MASIGLDHEALRTDNHRLIVCSLTPFGQSGPWRDFKSSDLTHLAAGGFMGCCGYDEADDPEQVPIAPGGGNAWHTAGNFAYMAILAALVYRDSSGEGQYIDVSVHDSIAVTTEMHIPTFLYHGKVVTRQTGRHAQMTPNAPGQFPCLDGNYVNAQSSRVPFKRFGDLVAWMKEHGLEEDLEDEKYATLKGVTEHADHIDGVIARFVAHLPADEIAHGGQQRQFNWGSIRAPEDLLEDEQLADRGFWGDVVHPELGRSFRYPGGPAIHNGSPWRISRRAPLVGEHNREIFGGELGLDDAALVTLAESGVL